MKLENYFNLNASVLHTDAGSKQDLLMEIARTARSSETLKHLDQEHLYKKLLEREKIGSTGFGDHIAIPHCTLDNINDFVVGVLISREGIDFNAIDGKPVKLFMYIIAPSKKRNEHIRILSEISKILRIPSYVEALLAQKSVSAFFKKFSDLGTWEISDELPRDYSQITVHIQDAEAFNGILEIFTEIQDCHVSVVEANNAGKYLYAMPLFSQFMNEEQKGFHRIILAVVNTVYINDTIRKVQTLSENLLCGGKVMVTTHSLNYYNGSIDI
ncbi:MAG: PTS sugar transporter subunit IIA [Candidatus Marinimicrobia bacterium]|nr:PTS sugar transporter subunit IIA [Candidatus Neomarinimicrobiota bacterium]